MIKISRGSFFLLPLLLLASEAHSALIYVANPAHISPGEYDLLTPTLPSSLPDPDGDVILTKVYLDTATDVTEIRLAFACSYYPACPPTGFASPIAAFFVSDGGTAPSGITSPFIMFNTPLFGGGFSFGPALLAGATTATLGLQLAQGTVNPNDPIGPSYLYLSFKYGDGSESGFAAAPYSLAPVPLPAAGWLLASALGLVGAVRRKRAAS